MYQTPLESGALRYFLPKDQRGTPTDQLTEQQFYALVGSALYAVASLLRISNTFEPTHEQILDTLSRASEQRGPLRAVSKPLLFRCLTFKRGWTCRSN